LKWEWTVYLVKYLLCDLASSLARGWPNRYLCEQCALVACSQAARNLTHVAVPGLRDANSIEENYRNRAMRVRSMLTGSPVIWPTSQFLGCETQTRLKKTIEIIIVARELDSKMFRS
jgi:hypothetical protein